MRETNKTNWTCALQKFTQIIRKINIIIKRKKKIKKLRKFDQQLDYSFYDVKDPLHFNQQQKIVYSIFHGFSQSLPLRCQSNHGMDVNQVVI